MESVFGVLMLVREKKINFKHERNTLREIWEGPQISKTLPPSIWYYLNFKYEKYRKESLVKNWSQFGQIEQSNSKEREFNALYLVPKENTLAMR